MDIPKFYLALLTLGFGLLAVVLTGLVLTNPRHRRTRMSGDEWFALGAVWAAAIYWLCRVL
jgi:hypothetical protein